MLGRVARAIFRAPTFDEHFVRTHRKKMSTPRVGFCGTGVMASALMGGLLQNNFCDESQVHVYDVSPASVSNCVGTRKSVQVCTSNSSVVANSSVVFLCVKPNVLPQLLQEVYQVCKEDTQRALLVSIAAGVTCAQIESQLPAGVRVVRVMPNTPCLVGQSASGYTAGKHATPEDLQLVHKIFSSVGKAVHVPNEKDLDAVTGLSGSGPAYIFLLIEALADGGVRAGLTRQVALDLAVQTVKGAAMMVEETKTHPGVLKDQVCSPGGTTIAGVEALERNGFRSAAIEAVTAATSRARELQALSKL